MEPFARALSPGLLAWLSEGAGRRLLAALIEHGLDIRLRDDYLNAYEAQSSVAKIVWRARRGIARIEVAAAYLAGTGLVRRDSGYVSIAATEDALEKYVRALPAIRERVNDKHKTPEGRWEADVVRTNRANTPFLVIDRQVQSPGLRKRLDVLAVSRDPDEPALLAVEIKRGVDPRIQLVPKQVGAYLEMLDPDLDGLRADVAESYRRVAAQLAALGLPAPAPDAFRPGMRVEGLVALASYPNASALLGRARKLAALMPRTVWFCRIDDANPRIPPRGEWFR
jgi:hypothetical protein